jgi:hypothetical protein
MKTKPLFPHNFFEPNGPSGVASERNMKHYKLTCLNWNTMHIRFAVFDPIGANCGEITILASDAVNFLQNAWKGDIFWDGKIPDYILSHKSNPILI